MYRYLVADYVERYESAVAVDRYLDLGALRAFHQTYHAVLRHLDTCHDLLVDLYDPVSLEKTGLFGRSTDYGIQDNRSVIRDIEGNAYTLEIARKLRFGRSLRRNLFSVRFRADQRG